MTELTERTGAPARGPESQISEQVVTILRDYSGRGATRVRTGIDRDVVTVTMADVLTKSERLLVEHGQAEHVLATRRAFQEMMRERVISAVERILDRKVQAFMSANHIDPDLAAEVFVLEPEPGQAS